MDVGAAEEAAVVVETHNGMGGHRQMTQACSLLMEFKGEDMVRMSSKQGN